MADWSKAQPDTCLLIAFLVMSITTVSIVLPDINDYDFCSPLCKDKTKWEVIIHDRRNRGACGGGKGGKDIRDE